MEIEAALSETRAVLKAASHAGDGVLGVIDDLLDRECIDFADDEDESCFVAWKDALRAALTRATALMEKKDG